MKDTIISPIFYMGNKKKLINKGLIELFPNNINTFVDLFSGSAVVSMNAKANKYILNDIDENLISLYKIFQDYSAEQIISHIKNRIEEFNLPKERTKRNEYSDKDKIEEYKASYMNFRKYYNKTKHPLDLYTLMFFAFSQQFRFNKNNEFNMPFGNDCFSERNKEYIKNGVEFFSKSNVRICNKSFETLKIDKLNKEDFVYLDSPYLNTTATYNEGRGQEGRNINSELLMYELCDNLNSKEIKFGMSNVFHNKGKEHTSLIEWCNKQGRNVYTFDSHTYSACGKGNSNAKEVFITNYDVNIS